MNFRSALHLLWILLLAGCPAPEGSDEADSSASNASDSTEVDSSEAESAEPATEETVEVEVQQASWAEVEKAIAAHQNKVVVVDLWSTTCAPCKREFPGLVKLSNEHKDDVICISVSLDYYGDPTEPPETYLPAVKEFLVEQQADLQNFLSTDVSDDVLAAVGAVSVPAVLIYNADGELVKTFEDDGSYGDEGFTYEEHITPAVEELLAANSVSE